VLNHPGIDPETYFSKTLFASSRENAVLALAQGAVDVWVNWWNSEDDSKLSRMLNKGMPKNADGSPTRREGFRIIPKSDVIINSAFAYLSHLPEGAKAGIAKAFFEAQTKHNDAFVKLSDGKNHPWAAGENDDYNKTFELVKFVDDLRRNKN
jgi:phosphonate transport system substrate-binding protein